MTKRDSHRDHSVPRSDLPGICRLGLYALCMIGFSLTASAGTYYRWVDDQGITHYTSAPPQGMASEKVASFTQSSSAPAPVAQAEAETDSSQSQEPQQPEPQVSQKNSERCAIARKRVKALQSNNRIRMATDDGEFRYLSQEDIQAELAASQKAIEESC